MNDVKTTELNIRYEVPDKRNLQVQVINATVTLRYGHGHSLEVVWTHKAQQVLPPRKVRHQWHSLCPWNIHSRLDRQPNTPKPCQGISWLMSPHTWLYKGPAGSFLYLLLLLLRLSSQKNPQRPTLFHIHLVPRFQVPAWALSQLCRTAEVAEVAPPGHVWNKKIQNVDLKRKE